jgi:predicted transcriptional regulator
LLAVAAASPATYIVLYTAAKANPPRIALDMTSRDIATKLFISERTVEAHVTNTFNKLGLNSRVELVRWLASVNGPEPITPAA